MRLKEEPLLAAVREARRVVRTGRPVSVADGADSEGTVTRFLVLLTREDAERLTPQMGNLRHLPVHLEDFE